MVPYTGLDKIISGHLGSAELVHGLANPPSGKCNVSKQCPFSSLFTKWCEPRATCNASTHIIAEQKLKFIEVQAAEQAIWGPHTSASPCDASTEGPASSSSSRPPLAQVTRRGSASAASSTAMQAARGASGAGRAARRCCSVHQVESACEANHTSLEDSGSAWRGQLGPHWAKQWFTN